MTASPTRTRAALRSITLVPGGWPSGSPPGPSRWSSPAVASFVSFDRDCSRVLTAPCDRSGDLCSRDVTAVGGVAEGRRQRVEDQCRGRGGLDKGTLAITLIGH